jgi:hypothetical protein
LALQSFPLPGQDVPLIGADGKLDPLWYQWFKQNVGSGAASALPSGQVNGYLLGTDGTTASWLGFLQAGAGAILRSWRDKMRDLVSVKDYGTNSTAFTNAISANTGVRVPSGAYSASASVGYGKMLTLDPGVSGVSISGDGNVIRNNDNPGNLQWTDSGSGKVNRSAIYADMGGYGNPDFGGYGLSFAIQGAIKIPSSSNQFHGSGLAGYAKTASTNSGAVAVFGQGEVNVSGSLAWGANFVAQDNGFSSRQIWGIEVDCNISNAATTCVGIDVVGGSSAEPFSLGYRLGPIGTFSTPPKRWTVGFTTAEGAAITAFEAGPTATTGTNIPSQPIVFRKRDSGGSAVNGGRIFNGGAALNMQLDDSSDFLRLKTDSSTIAFQAQGNKIGFFGTALTSKGTVTGSKGGIAALDSLLIELSNLGLINNSST